MTGYLTADGKSSADFNVYLSDAGVYGMPERDVEMISVPGRNGDLLIENNRFKNKSLFYPCAIVGDFDSNFTAFIGYLLSRAGYVRLEDSFHPDEYVLAKYTGETDPHRVKRDRIGTFRIEFTRKPQRFLKSGEDAVAFTGSGSLFNEQYGTALPMVRVYGTGEVSIGSTTISITSADEYTDIDSDTQNAFKGEVNCNGNIVLNSGEFFSLPPGESGVAFSGDVTRIEIIPRWWRL